MVIQEFEKFKMATIQTGSTCFLARRRDRNVISNTNSMFIGTVKSMAVHRMLRHVSGSGKSKMATIRTGSTCILPSRRDGNMVSNPNSMFIGTDNSMAVHRMLRHVSGSGKSKIATIRTGSTCI